MATEFSTISDNSKKVLNVWKINCLIWIIGHIEIRNIEQAVYGNDCVRLQKGKIKRSENFFQTKWIQGNLNISWKNYNKKRFESWIELTRNILRLVAYPLAGHCSLKVHLFRMEIVSNSTLKFCGD